MTDNTQQNNDDIRPWYREPWPWVLIAIPLLTVVASMITLWLALTHPEHIVTDDTSQRPAKAGVITTQPTVQPSSSAQADDGTDR